MNFDPEHLLLELDAARTIRDHHIGSMDDMVRRYHQRDYKGFDHTDFAPENHEADYTSLMIPKIAYAWPRCKTRYPRPGPGKIEAKALRAGLNQWSEESGLNEVGQLVACDYLFNFGVFYTTQEPMPDSYGSDPTRPHWPKVRRLSQKQFLMDPLCGFFGHARWCGHDYSIEKDQLIQMAEENPDLGWNVDIIEEMATTRDIPWQQHSDIPHDREQFMISRVFVPGQYEKRAPGPEQGYAGTIYTIVKGQSGDDWVRKPIPYYGPRWGPYSLAGAYAVPDSPWPLGPLTMVKGRVDELNAHAVAASKSMSEYKRLVLIDASQADLAQNIKRPDAFIIPVKNLKSENAIEFEIGGLTAQQLQAISMLRERLDRAAAMSEAKRGNTTGGTATENAIADQSSEVRIAHLKQRYTQAVIRVYQTAGWYMLHDERVSFVLNDEAGREIGAQGPAYFLGGAGNPNSQIAQQGGYVNPDEMVFEIEPYSGDFVGQGVARQQFVQALQTAMGMTPMVPQMPWINWKDLFRKFGDAFNDDDWAEMFNFDMAAKMAGLPGAQPQTPTPLFSSMMPSIPMMGAGGGFQAMGGGQPGFQQGAGSSLDMLMQNARGPGQLAGNVAAGNAA